MELSPDGIRSVLKTVKYPGFTRDIVSFGIVKNIKVEGSSVEISLVLPKPDSKLESEITESVRNRILETPGVGDVSIRIAAREPRPAPGQGPARAEAQSKLPKVKYYIAVASGKGGVGKSTVAVNLAVAIAKKRKNVGLMDADIWGPSLPIMLGITDRPHATEENKIIPLEKHGLKLMSIGFLISDDETVIWRGPMVHGAIKQFIEDVEWGDTEYLVIDLPPGTGDAQLSIVQTAPLTGGLIVTTPQDVALVDVKRGVNMFRKLNVPIIGIVENMSYLDVPGTEPVDIFGRGGGRRMAEKFEVPFLGEIPLDPRIRKGGDSGVPIVESDPGTAAGKAFDALADIVLEAVESSGK
ncbi:MAG TPA: Mrp/NBP35 family ATP-binding protein [Thermodesulfobacteriota bacterium]|nr:Mrp/NBP35 family ATP-binding protein [Thermodesulfobacteriota bacterium]